MPKNLIYIYFLLFSYAFALGHDLVPHHHFDDVQEFNHHKHSDHDNNQPDAVCNDIADSDETKHLFCHASTDLTSLNTDSSCFKSGKKCCCADYVCGETLASGIYIHNYSRSEIYTSSGQSLISGHLLSSGLRAPPIIG